MRVEDRAHPVRALGRHDHVGELRVDRLAQVVEVLELRALAGQRTLASLAPRPGELEPDVEPDHQMVGQCRPDSLVTDRAATEREHTRLPRIEELQGDLLLDGAERRLAVLGEHALDRLAEPLLDHGVDVDGDRAELVRGAAGCGRLAGAHESDADDPAPAGAAPLGYRRRHAIRSS